MNFYLVIYLQVYTTDGSTRFGEAVMLLRAFPQTVSLAFILFALGKVLLRRRSDLIERRRNFRLKFIGITSFYMMLVLISELVYQEKNAPALLDLIHSGGILLTVWYFAVRIFTVSEGTLGEVEAPLKRTTEAAEHLQTQEYLLRRLINGALSYKNFNDYLNELRIKEACRILADTEQASTHIIRITMDLGFGSLAPCNRAFKERTQMTPTEYRKKT